MAKLGAADLTFWFASATLEAEVTKKPLFSMAFESLFRNGSSSSTMSKDLFSNCPRFNFEVKILFIETQV
jgi:hypothetical protein